MKEKEIILYGKMDPEKRRAELKDSGYNFPKKLYKYLSEEAIKNWLYPPLSLRYTPPYELNDPYEVFPKFDIYMSDKAIIDAYKLVEPNSTESSTNIFLNKIYDDLAKHNVDHFKKFCIQNNIGILSMSANPLSIPMWSYYASCHAGAVFEINVDHDFFYGLIGCTEFKPVNYSISRPIASTNFYKSSLKSIKSEINKWLTTKSKEWEHEEEYRSITYLVNAFKSSDNKTGTLFIPDSVITAVYLGIRTNGKTLDKLSDYCCMYNIPCGRVRYDLNEYKLLAPNLNSPIIDNEI